MQNGERGLQQDNFRLLRMSYRVGPNEGMRDGYRFAEIGSR
jgi:hypothetical protein